MASYRAPDTIAAEVLDGEAIVIDLVSGAYFSFSGWTSWAWECLTAGVDSDIVGAAFAEIGGFDEFLAGTIAAGLLVARGDVPVGIAPEPPADRVTTPEFDRFDDMADMIQLDPVHDVSRESGWPRPADG